MKKQLILISFLISITTCLSAQSEYLEAPSDKATSGAKTDNSKAQTLELIAIFNDAIDAPTKYNEYVKSYIQDKSFPAKKKNETKEDFDLLIEKWISENPQKIKALLNDRKKAHDKLYGPRKK